MELYFIIKNTHILFIVLSLSFYTINLAFNIRGVKPKKIFTIAPHIINTFLLISGISLCFIIQQYPLSSSWLSGKMVALLGYVFVAVVSLRSKRGKMFKIICFVGAVSWLLFAAKLAVFKNSFFIN